MQKHLKAITILGFLVIIIPFFGVPLLWKQWVLLILGGSIMTLALLARRRTSTTSGEPSVNAGELENKPYAENGYEYDMAVHEEV